MADIDRKDYALLKCLKDADGPLWKKRIHEQLHERADDLPGNSEMSLQTVGRRVNTLNDIGAIETAITSSDDVNRDLIIGYDLTDTGTAILEEKREEILLSTDSFVPQNEAEIAERKDTILTLLDDEFDLSSAGKKFLEERFDKTDLITLYAVYIVNQNLERLRGEDEEKFRELFELEDGLGKQIATGITTR